MTTVALLAEGVDRNNLGSEVLRRGRGSPSSRRAWIEILLVRGLSRLDTGRPPRGGRG